MFCGICGREMIGGTRVCPYCGTEQTAVVIPAVSIPVSVPISEPVDTTSVPYVSSVPNASSVPVSDGIPNSPDAPIEASKSESIPAGDNSTSSASAAAPVSAAVPPAAIPGIPTPNTIPTNNLDMPETAVRTTYVQTAASQTAAAQTTVLTAPTRPVINTAHHTEITIKDEAKPEPERKYSLKHLMMCLAAAAVMAIAAGVFAGLYFSVIFTK